MSTHTPGPWVVDAVFGEALHDVILGYEVPGEGSPIVIATAYADDTEHRHIPSQEAEGNARLIAAAPQLLAACKPVLREAEQRADFHYPNWNEDAHIELTLTIREVRAVAAAVKKAEGGAA